MRALALGVALLFVAGCGLYFQPGAGVTPALAEQWRCDHEDVARMAEEARAELPPGQQWAPKVGWDACELMARIGAPSDTQTQQTEYGYTADWWYRTGSDTHLVSLELRTAAAGRWVVTYVSW